MSDDDLLRIYCQCGQKMKVPANAVGKTAACVRCGKKFRVTPEMADQGRASSNGRDREVFIDPTTLPRVPEDQFSGIVKLLLDEHCVRKGHVAEAYLLAQDLPGPLWEILIDLGHMTAESFHKLMTTQAKAASIDLGNYTIPQDVMGFIPYEMARKHMLLPVDKLGKLLTLAMVCPMDFEAPAMIEERTGLRVKVMACRMDQFRKVLSQVYPGARDEKTDDDPVSAEVRKEFAELLEQSEVARRIFALDHFAPLPDTMKGLAAASSSSVPLLGMAEALMGDLGATARVIQVANCAAYGLPRRVDNLGLAATLLGAKAMGSVMGALTARDYFAQSDEFDYRGLWQRARFRAEAARAIAEMSGARSTTAHGAGLLAEMGCLALAEVLPNSYPVLTRGKSGDELAALERRVFGIDHAEAGCLLARRWNLPHGLSEPLRYQHHPHEALRAKDMVNVLALANVLTEAHQGRNPEALTKAYPLLRSLKLNRGKVDAIVRETASLVSAG